MDLHIVAFFHPEVAILLLLDLIQRLIEHFQFQCLLDIGPVSEPEHQFIAGINALLALAGLVIKERQLKRPFFGIFLFLQFLQQGDLLTHLCPLGLHHLVSEDISQIIMRRNIHKFIVILLRLLKIFHPDRKLRQTIDDHPADGGTVIRGQKDFPRIFIALYLLISLSRLHQGIDVFDLFPVDLIAKVCGLRILFLTNELF